MLYRTFDDKVTADNELAYAGITCLVCHSVESTRPDGNASFTLTPVDGGARTEVDFKIYVDPEQRELNPDRTVEVDDGALGKQGCK